MRRKFFLSVLFAIACIHSQSQNTKRVLYLGNSYTGTNYLPQITATLALTTGDTLIVDSNTPGGYTLQMHSTDATSLNKIMAGIWDYVVLQAQSLVSSLLVSFVVVCVSL